ncbi:sugar phosphate nucleotidyltransferase [Desulfofundulus salinus]|nr:sugar phosphate nucleotidyltransferase [Desulfofundulus salinum]
MEKRFKLPKKGMRDKNVSKKLHKRRMPRRTGGCALFYAVIMAGGARERFWPLSRRDRPKQFLSLVGERTMLQLTFDRLAGLVPPRMCWSLLV